MTNEKLFIPLLLGTNREGRWSVHAARLVYQYMEERDDLETQWFDARDFDFPKEGYGQALKDRFPEYRDAIVRADGLVIVTPEYNHGYPGVLKSILDILLPEYNHKAAALVAVSRGSWGGTRVIENLLPVLRELGLAASSTDLHFPKVRASFNEQGVPTKEAKERYAKLVPKFLDELVFLAQALKRAREETAQSKKL